jgi:hypothetical protein
VPNYGIVDSMVAAWLGARPGGRGRRALNEPCNSALDPVSAARFPPSPNYADRFHCRKPNRMSHLIALRVDSAGATADLPPICGECSHSPAILMYFEGATATLYTVPVNNICPKCFGPVSPRAPGI